MPPDSLYQAAGVPGDTLRQTTIQPAKQPEEFKSWQENIFYPVLATLIGALIIFLITRVWKKITGRISGKVVKLISFSDETAREVSKNFIPNNFMIMESDNTPVERIEEKSMEYFLKQILRDNYSFYFLTAPTGVGKTTFLLNAFQNYKKSAKKPFSLYCGRAHDPVFKNTIDQLIREKKADKTILLIDALDEFEIKANSPEEYWEKFEAAWDVYKEKLCHFKKVIVSVREQFLQFRNIEKVKILYQTGSILSRQIKLLPFETESQRELYLDKRYSDQAAKYRDNLKWLAFKFDEKGLSFIHLPLILNFMEDIWAAYEIEKVKYTVEVFEHSNFFSLYNLLKIIEDAWLQREARTKGFDQQQIGLIRTFCIDLAYQIARSGKQTHITGAELIGFEKNRNIVQQFQGMGDRSLLIRNKMTTEQEDTYGFVHNYFLELFLIQYILAYPGIIDDISFVNYQFTVDVITRFRWDQLKNSAPVIHRDPDDHEFDPSAEALGKLGAWFDQVFYNDEVRKLLDKTCEIYAVLRRQDPAWYNSFPNINGLVIKNKNYWNEKLEQPYPQSSRAVYLFRPFIKIVSLIEIPLVDEHLEVFAGINSVEYLQIRNARITIKGLSAFQHSAASLDSLDISWNFLDDDSLFYFRNATKIRLLNLEANLFTSTGLGYLRHCREGIRELTLGFNKIDDTGFSFFAGAENLKKIYLRDNPMTGKILQYIERSVPAITYVQLENLDISDEHLLHLPDFEALEYLSLAGTKVEGLALKKIQKSTGFLRWLDLTSTKINDDSILALSGFENISLLHLEGTPIRGLCLKVFTSCTKTIKSLALGNTNIDDDAALEAFAETSNLENLSLRNLRINGSGLVFFINNRDTLQKLYLNNCTTLATESLQVFTSFSRLEDLNLANLNISNTELWYFERSRNSLMELNISSNPRITDLSFALSCPVLTKLMIENCFDFDEKELNQLRLRNVEILVRQVIES